MTSNPQRRPRSPSPPSSSPPPSPPPCRLQTHWWPQPPEEMLKIKRCDDEMMMMGWWWRIWDDDVTWTPNWDAEWMCLMRLEHPSETKSCLEREEAEERERRWRWREKSITTLTQFIPISYLTWCDMMCVMWVW